MRKSILIFAVAFLLLMLVPSAFAGSFFTVMDTKDVNGSIAFDLRNDFGSDIIPDAEGAHGGYLVFQYDGENISVLSSSVLRIRPERTGTVVLDKALPTSGYINISIIYYETDGVSYPPETYPVFASNGLTLKSFSSGTGRQYSNDTLFVTFSMKADGETDISSIDVDVLDNPQYFIYETKSAPNKMNKGDERDFTITFKPQKSMPDTIIYTTVYIPIFVSYKYVDGLASTQRFNESVIVMNEDKVKGTEPPKMNAKLDMPKTLKQGESADVKVYLYNSNTGGHSACNVKLSLGSSDGKVSIPIQTITPLNNKIEPTAYYPADPLETFAINTADTIASGMYSLTLTVDYEDCDWKFEESFTSSVEFEVISDATNTTTDTEDATTDTEDTTTQTDEETTDAESTLIFYLTLGLLVAVVVFLVVHFLQMWSRYA
ncbi:MAG: hypothetical protein ABIG20_02545 [archaeon]